MKLLSKKAKVLSCICLSTSLSLSALTLPIMANSFNKIESTTQAPEKTERPSKPCHGCKRHRPFKRFTAAMNTLKEEKLVSAEDIKKIYDALMKIPPETVEESPDKDQSIADALYKDKVLTEEQYQKICAFLKANPPRK